MLNPSLESDVVRIESLSFAYDTRPILHEVSLRIPRGKVVAIMGASGCGKTTLLRMIGGSIRPTAGVARVFGVDTTQLDTAGLYRMRRRMGMLFQFGALFTDMSVYDNVAFALREHTGLPESAIRDLVLMKLDAVGLRGVAHAMPSSLSGGMARRVALARTVALDPALIMYDEPFAGLDPISLGVIARLIRRLNDALGATSIIVTHDVEESLQIVDYIYFVSGGRIIAEGTAEAVRASGVPYVRQFVRGETDGPVPFHYPAADYWSDLAVPKAA